MRLENVKLKDVKQVTKKHLRSPLYVAVYESEQGNVSEVEIGLRLEPENLYKIGERYDVETMLKYGTARIVTIAPAGATPVAPKVTGLVKGTKSYTKEFPVPVLHGDRSIIRQNSLAHATNVALAVYKGHLEGGDKVKPKAEEKLAAIIVDIARQFEEYSAGDVERREAERQTEAASAQEASNGGG